MLASFQARAAAGLASFAAICRTLPPLSSAQTDWSIIVCARSLTGMVCPK